MLVIESVQSRCVWPSQEYCVSRISKSSFYGKLSWRRGLVLYKIGENRDTPGLFLDFSRLWFIPIFCTGFWRYHCVIHNDNVTSKLQSEFHGFTFILIQIMPKIIYEGQIDHSLVLLALAFVMFITSASRYFAFCLLFSLCHCTLP